MLIFIPENTAMAKTNAVLPSEAEAQGYRPSAAIRLCSWRDGTCRGESTNRETHLLWNATCQRNTELSPQGLQVSETRC